MKRPNRFLFVCLLSTILLTGILFLSQCTFKDPAAPSWDVTFYIPLIDRLYTMEEAAEDTKEMTVDTLNKELDLRFDSDFSMSVMGELTTGVTGVPQNFAVNSSRIDSTVWIEGIVVHGYSMIDSAWIVIECENPTEHDMSANYEMLNIWRNGTRFSHTFDFNQDAAIQKDSVLIDDCEFLPATTDPFNFFTYNVTVSAPGASGSVNLTYNMKGLKFQELEGRMLSAGVDFENVEFDSLFTDYFEGFELYTVDMLLLVNNDMPVPLGLDLLMEGSDFSGDPADPIPIQADIPAESEGTEIPFGGPEFVSFINGQPQHIGVGGHIEIGEDKVVTISQEDSVTGTFIFEMPLIFGLEQRINRIEPDTIFSIDEDTRNSIRDNLVSVSIHSDITNHLPLTAGVTMYFSGISKDSTVVYGEPDLIIGPVELGAATMNTSGGEPYTVLEPAVTQWSRVLTKEEDVRFFEEHEDIFYGLEFNFGTTDGIVKIQPSDYIQVTAYATVDVRVAFPEDEDSEEGGGL